MPQRNILFFIAVFVFYFHQALSQPVLKFDYNEYNVTKGLSNNLVFSIAQDKLGYVWIGTEDGLNRFDGYSFTPYQYLENDSNSVISNEIRALLPDKDGSLWIGTNNGVCRYFPDRDYVKRYEINYSDASKLHGNYVSSIKQHPDGSVWISYVGSGIDIVYPDKDFVLHYTMYRNDNYILANDLITSTTFLPDGNVLLGGHEGMQVIGKDQHVFSKSEIAVSYPWSASLPKHSTNTLLTGDGKKLWVGTVQGLYCVDLISNSVTSFNTSNSELQSNEILALFEDSENNIWIGADALYQIEKEGTMPIWFNKYGMYIKNSTNVIFEDNGKNIWIGTTRGGVRKLNKQNSDILHFHSNQGEGSIKSDEILSFNSDNAGKLWLSAGGIGLYEVDTNDKFDYTFREFELNSKLRSKTIKKIYKDKNGLFWLGAWGGGLSILDPIKKSLTEFAPRKGNFTSQHVWDIVDDGHDNYWFATLHDGLYHYSMTSGVLTNYKHVEQDTNSVAHNDVLSLLLDSQQRLWVGTGSGISVRLLNDNKFLNFFEVDSKRTKALTSNVILCMTEDAAGNIWLGTKGAGVLIVKLDNNKLQLVKQLTREQGLISDIVNSFQSDAHRNIWVTSNKGITRIKADNFVVDHLNKALSLRGVDFLTNATYRSPQGRMFFGSSGGFYSVNPDNNEINLQPPPIIFQELRLNNNVITPTPGGEILQKPIAFTREITIPAAYNYYSFEFAALNYNNTEQNQYAYKLEEFDDGWNFIGDQHSISFSDLPPGAYTLRVIASNNDEVWNENGAALIIHILPPWYKTWLFYVSITFFLVFIILIYINWRVRSVSKINRLLEQQVKERTAELIVKNRELSESSEEIVAQNEELVEAQNIVYAQRDTLVDQNEEIRVKNDQLEESYATLQRQKDELEGLYREKAGMINVIVHDLKSPLNQISGLADILKADCKLTAEQTTFVDLIKKILLGGSMLINDLLELHGVESQSSKEPNEEINLSDFMNEWIVSHQSVLKQKDQQVLLSFQQGLPIISSVKKYLSRILDNLLTNASKFSERGKVIKVEVWMEGEIKIAVIDQGLGMSEDDQKNMFTPFRKLSARPTAGESSSGLGLSIVKLLVEKLDGKIEVVSKLYVGTKVTITLPQNRSSHINY